MRARKEYDTISPADDGDIEVGRGSSTTREGATTDVLDRRQEPLRDTNKLKDGDEMEIQAMLMRLKDLVRPIRFALRVWVCGPWHPNQAFQRSEHLSLV